MDSKETKVELTIQSNLDYAELVENLTNHLTAMAGCTADQAYFIEMSIREMVANAILHGNKRDLNKHVAIQYCFDREIFQVQIQDEGPGFDCGQVPDPLHPENLLKSSGRGIFLVRSFMDEFSCRYIPRQGMRVVFSKKISS